MVFSFQLIPVSWMSINDGLTNTNVRAFAIDGSTLYAGTWGGGVFFIKENTSNWTAVSNGLTYSYIQALAFCGTNLYARNWRRCFSFNK